jgi:hypothetical protein
MRGLSQNVFKFPPCLLTFYGLFSLLKWKVYEVLGCYGGKEEAHKPAVMKVWGSHRSWCIEQRKHRHLDKDERGEKKQPV